jgi:hypothetical protein
MASPRNFRDVPNLGLCFLEAGMSRPQNAIRTGQTLVCSGGRLHFMHAPGRGAIDAERDERRALAWQSTRKDRSTVAAEQTLKALGPVTLLAQR